MIEYWLSTAWKWLHSARKRFSFIPPGCWVVILVVAIVGGRLFWVKSQYDKKEKISMAFGKANLPSGVPQVSPDGKQLTLVQMGDDGLAVFMYDLSAQRRQMVHQKGAKQDIFLNLRVWPWSPDNHHFIYTAEELVVCERGSCREVARIATGGFNRVESLVWLGPSRFAFVTAGGNLHLVRRDNNDQWKEAELPFYRKIGQQSFTALSHDTVAWLGGNLIWTLNVDSRQLGILYEHKGGELKDFCYSPETRQFLISSTENGSDVLRRMQPGNNASSNKVSIAQSSSIHRMSWLTGNSGLCVYLSANPHKPHENSLTIELDRASDPIRLFEEGSVSGFTTTADGKHLFAVGIVSNELAAGIWEFDLEHRKLKEVVPCTDQPTTEATSVSPIHGVISKNGRNLDIYVYPPSGLNRTSSKKHPLVIGNTLFRLQDPVYQNRMEGPLWAPALARCGACVVIVERSGSWFNGIDGWGDNVMAAYEFFCKEPTVDTNRVFLFATSAETPYLRDLVSLKPDLWAGLLLFNGTTVDLSSLGGARLPPRVLLTAGEYENMKDYLYDFQQSCAKIGVVGEVVIHPKTAHVLTGKNSLAQKNRAIARFIFEE